MGEEDSSYFCSKPKMEIPMATEHDIESVGLKGAKAAGDKRVSTLSSFSWASLRASKLARREGESHATDRGNSNDAEAEPAVHREGRRQAA